MHNNNFLGIMLVVRKSGQFRMVWGIIVAENQVIVTPLVMVTVHQSDYNILNLHQLAKIKPRPIGEIQITTDQTRAIGSLI